MTFVHFIHVECQDAGRTIAPERLEQVRQVVRSIPALQRGLFYLPAQARDYYTNDGPSPRLALQLYYARLEELEDTIRADGILQQLAQPSLWQDLPGVKINHQVMYARPFPVADPQPQPDADSPMCAYLVHYPGYAENFNDWLNHYLDFHPQIMHDFPRIREVEIYTRVDWRDAMPWERVEHMQRNRLIFDSPAALEAGLNGPIRHRMRADFEAFPPFHGSNIHYPMLLQELVGKSS